MDLQELITRGRFVFANAPDRLTVFNLINGKRTAADIAKIVKRHVTSVHRDLRKLRNSGLIEGRIDSDGLVVKTDEFTVYEKVPLARTVPSSYFSGVAKIQKANSRPKSSSKSSPKASKRPTALKVPTEVEALEICKEGEDQLHEFKGAGTDVRKVTREIAAMLNTRDGGLILYGVQDDGTIQGTDVMRQKMDQPLQNSVKNSISPAAIVRLYSVSVLGTPILVVVVPPWNRKDVYQFDEKVLIRKGTNVFAAKPEELRKLHRGDYVI